MLIDQTCDLIKSAMKLVSVALEVENYSFTWQHYLAAATPPLPAVQGASRAATIYGSRSPCLLAPQHHPHCHILCPAAFLRLKWTQARQIWRRERAASQPLCTLAAVSPTTQSLTALDIQLVKAKLLGHGMASKMLMSLDQRVLMKSLQYSSALPQSADAERLNMIHLGVICTAAQDND